MCGIVGASSSRNVVPILIDGVRRLEYRGYDSTGLAVIGAGSSPTLQRLVSVARVADLAAQANACHLSGTTGISHTRWATHGAPNEGNAHPHVSGGEVAVVHNGIIENYEELREMLKARGYVFATQTDTEVIAHLVHAHWHADGGGDLLRAVQAAVAQFHGAYAIAAISTREPGRVVGARQGSPLVVGIGEGDHFLASDAAALVPVTRRVAYLEEGDVADVRREPYAIYDAQGNARRARRHHRRAGRRRGRARARTAISCRRRSSSSRARWPTRSKRVGAITPKLFGAKADATSARRRSRADPRLRHQLFLGLGREAVDRIGRAAFPATSKSPASTAIATACRIRARWSSSCRNRAKPPTRSPR